MIKRTDVEFEADGGVKLRGWLFVPPGEGRRPAITMAHGYAGVKEHALEPFARVRRSWLRRAAARPSGLRRERRHAALRHRSVASDRGLATRHQLSRKSRRRRSCSHRPLGHELCWRPCDRARRNRPAPALRRRAGANDQRLRTGCAALRRRTLPRSRKRSPTTIAHNCAASHPGVRRSSVPTPRPLRRIVRRTRSTSICNRCQTTRGKTT